MSSFGDLLGSIGIGGGGGGSNLLTLVWLFAIVIFSFMAIGGIIYFFYNKKSWNLKVEFKLPRSVKYLREGEDLDVNDVQGFVGAEWGKGCYNARKGVVWLKRKGLKKIKMKPFNITRYLQNKTLTVIQVGATDYLPVLPESFLILEDENTGEQATVLSIKADTSESKSWKNSFEREAKQAYSIVSMLREYAPIIAIGIVIFLWGIQMLLLYTRIK